MATRTYLQRYSAILKNQPLGKPLLVRVERELRNNSTGDQMKKEAVQQAWERFHKAQWAYHGIIASKRLDDVDLAWLDLLIAAAGIYSKLEKGAKGGGKSEQWFGTVKHLRRTDELLSYIHHARNSDEHGIARITKHSPGHIVLNVGPKGAFGVPITLPDGRFGLHFDDDQDVEVEQHPAKVHLLPVTDDRFGDTFQVPTMHLGQPVGEPTPERVGQLALTYLESLLRKAGTLIR